MYQITIKECENINPQVPWDDLKIGETYHIPPINGHDRCNITIVNKTPTYLSYRKNKSGSIEFMYPTYVIAKFIVRCKN